MGALLSHLTSQLADSLCAGSSRKLIAGWWYTILIVSFILLMMAFWTVSTRGAAESFAAFWATAVILLLSVGGTMVMRKFHNSVAVGFFLGSVVATSQFFFLLFLIYLGFSRERKDLVLPSGEEGLQAVICLVQSVLLGSFAAILGAHRSEILDRNSSIHQDKSNDMSDSAVSSTLYEPPRV